MHALIRILMRTNVDTNADADTDTDTAYAYTHSATDADPSSLIICFMCVMCCVWVWVYRDNVASLSAVLGCLDARTGECAVRQITEDVIPGFCRFVSRHRAILGPPLTQARDWRKLRAVAWLLNAGFTGGVIEFVVVSALKDSPAVAVFRQSNKAAAKAAAAAAEEEEEHNHDDDDDDEGGGDGGGDVKGGGGATTSKTTSKRKSQGKKTR
jgi:hypothetical protein